MSEQDKPASTQASTPDGNGDGTSRRMFMVGGAAAVGAAAIGRARSSGKITDNQARLLDKITASATGAASLSDVKHIVILMQENRSFDHYFGTLSGVAGFSDPNALPGVFDQYGYEPGRRGHRGRLHPAVQPAEQPADRERVRHQRHRPQLGRPAQQLERRGDELLHHLAPGDRRRRQRPGHDGLLHPRRAAVLLRPGRRVHDLRRLPLLGARPDRPEPADGVLGLDRPGRARRAARSSPPPPTGSG